MISTANQNHLPLMVRSMNTGNANLKWGSKAFTLVELLVVMVIVGILAAIVAPMVYQHISPAKRTAVRGQMKNFMTALDNFYVDVGRFPTTKEGLDALRLQPVGAKGWRGPYLRRNIPNDPWGNTFIYREPGSNGPYDIVSLGSDGREGGEGEEADIISWQVE